MLYTPQEYPILFSTPMAEATYDNCKTVTRRMKGLKGINKSPDDWLCPGWTDIDLIPYFMFANKVDRLKSAYIKCPYGQIGDWLYVRETWVSLGHNNCQDGAEQRNVIVFKASQGGKEWEESMEGWRWKSGIHLKKEDSRMWLEITGVRVERLHDITTSDAVSEGILYSDDAGAFYDYVNRRFDLNPTASLMTLWESINGKGSWNTNPWLWVLDYKLISNTGRPHKEI